MAALNSGCLDVESLNSKDVLSDKPPTDLVSKDLLYVDNVFIT